MKTYVIIVTYNGMKWISKCLESIKPYSVILIDNNSSDGTVNFVKSNYPEIIILKQEKNLGFGQANNIGISYALKEGAMFVFLLNQDAYLIGDCIECLIQIHKGNPNFGILSPIHLNGIGNRLDENFSNYLNYKANPNFYSDFILPEKNIKRIYEVPFVNAAGWLISKECLLKVGGFDPIFFHYGEDDNYCQRVRYHKLSIGVVTNAYLNHDREKRKNKNSSHNKYGFSELSLKLKYTNINSNIFETFFTYVYNREKIANRYLLKLNFRAAKNYRKEARFLRETYLKIKNSRVINKSVGASYLNI